jgi:nitrate/nitrite transporter NarK
MSIFGNLFIGRICDKIGPEKIFIICFIMMSVALFWLVLADKVWMFREVLRMHNQMF